MKIINLRKTVFSKYGKLEGSTYKIQFEIDGVLKDLVCLSSKYTNDQNVETNNLVVYELKCTSELFDSTTVDPQGKPIVVTSVPQWELTPLEIDNDTKELLYNYIIGELDIDEPT